MRRFLKTSDGFTAGLTTAAVITPSCAICEQTRTLRGSNSSSIRGHDQEVTSLENRWQVTFSFQVSLALHLNNNRIFVPMRSNN